MTLDRRAREAKVPVSASERDELNRLRKENAGLDKTTSFEEGRGLLLLRA
jgi:hypothetical protein